VARFDRVIPPGEEGTIDAQVETDRYKGPISKSLTVRTNDPDHQVASLQMKANVISLIEVSPSWMISLQADQGKPATAEAFLKGLDPAKPFEVIGATSSDKNIAVKFSKLKEDDPQGDYRVVVEVSPDAPMGPIDAKIVVSTTLEEQRRVRIPVTGKVHGPVNFFPARIVMFADQSGRPARLGGTIVLQARPGKPPFEITAVEADRDALELSPFVKGPAEVHRVGVIWRDADTKGVFAGTIRIRTNVEEMPEIEVPYQVRIQ
jgi:hypothetical protein